MYNLISRFSKSFLKSSITNSVVQSQFYLVMAVLGYSLETHKHCRSQCWSLHWKEYLNLWHNI